MDFRTFRFAKSKPFASGKTKVILDTYSSVTPREEDEEVQAFCKTWAQDSSVSASSTDFGKNFTEARGVSLQALEGVIEDFLASENITLYTLKKRTKLKLTWLAEGTVVAALGNNGDSPMIDVEVPGLDSQARFEACDLEIIKREDWTIAQVINYKLAQDYREIYGKSFYSQLRAEAGALGPLFEGGYCIVSRESNFVRVIRTIVEKAKSENIPYLYFDFLAINQAEKEYFRNDTASSRSIRKDFITKVCPMLVNCFDKVYLYVNDWKNASVFNRGWCMFELYWAFKKNIEVDIAYPFYILKDFQGAVAEDFRNDFFSYHDLCSTIFSSFHHLTLSTLKSGSKMDNELIANQLVDIDNSSPENEGVKELLSSRLLLLFARIVVDIGNMKLKELSAAIREGQEQKIRSSIDLLRRCGLYLRRAGFNKEALQFFDFCREAVEKMPFLSLSHVFNCFSSIMRLRYDCTRCLAREILKKNTEGGDKINKEVSVRAVKELIQGNAAQNIASCSIIVEKLLQLFEDKKEALGFNAESSEMIKRLLPRMEEDLLGFSRLAMKGEKQMPPTFLEDSMGYLLENYDLSKEYCQKIIEFGKQCSYKEESLLQLQSSGNYTKYLLDLAFLDIDLESQKLLQRELTPEIRQVFNMSEMVLRKLGKACPGDPRPLMQEVYLKLDHVRVLLRSTESRDHIKLGIVLEQLNYLMEQRMRGMESEEASGQRNRAEFKLEARLTFAVVLFETAKFSYKFEVRPPEQCLELLNRSLHFVEGTKSMRAESLRHEIKFQLDLLDGSESVEIVEKSYVSDRSFVTRRRNFSFVDYI